MGPRRQQEKRNFFSWKKMIQRGFFFNYRGPLALRRTVEGSISGEGIPGMVLNADWAGVRWGWDEMGWISDRVGEVNEGVRVGGRDRDRRNT